LAATLQTKPVESVAEKPKPAPLPVAPAPAAPFSAAQKPAGTEENAQTAPANSTPTDEPDAALVEAVVQRVLDKMRPQVVEIITKEFLRPVVQALVNREIQKR
jgi:septal ring-binding cell division protein DamX